jgi:hypothetical protein
LEREREIVVAAREKGGIRIWEWVEERGRWLVAL